MSVEPIPSISKRHARRNEWREKQINALLLLRQKFPQTFARLNARTRRPIKVGLRDDLVKALPDLDGSAIGRALQFYTRDFRYQRSLVEGATRIDLAGNGAGTVTRAEAENASRAVAGIEAKLAKRRGQQKSAPSPSPSSPSSLPAPTPTPSKRISLADLRASAAGRKLAAGA